MKRKIFNFVSSVVMLGSFSTWLVLNAKAATMSTTIAAAGFSNVVALAGSATVKQVILSSPANNTSLVQFYDVNTNSTRFTNAAYIGVSSYVTNCITVWTNFFGGTNYMTNVCLVDITNTVPAYSNFYPATMTLAIGTNQSYTAEGLNYIFNRGVWATNLGSGNATVTVTYQQP